MLDRVTTPWLFLALGKLGKEFLADACEAFVKDKLTPLLGWFGKLGGRSVLELACEAYQRKRVTDSPETARCP